MKNFIILFITFLVTVLGGIYLTIQDYPTSYWSVRSTTFVPDEVLGFVRRTSYSYEEINQNAKKPISYRINNLGLRGEDIADIKTKPRVLLVGSSIIFGQGVEEKYTVAKQLNINNTEVINAGLVAYSLDQKFKILQLKLIDQLKPDEILFFISSIDFVSLRKSAFILNLYDYHPENDSLVEKNMSESLFYRSSILGKSLNDILNWPRFLGLVHTVINKLNNSFEINQVEPFEIQRVAKMLNEIKKNCEERKIKIHFFILPDKPMAGASQYSALAERVELVDLNKSQSFENSKDTLFLEDEFHLSPAGHAAVARELSSFYR